MARHIREIAPKPLKPARIVYCEQCGCQVDYVKIRKGGLKRCPKYCCAECRNAAQRANGHYKRLSRFGNDAQHARNTYNDPHRRAAISKSNSVKPRRARNKD